MATTDWLEDVVLDLTVVETMADLDPGSLLWEPAGEGDPR
jgi:hypothetical protein